MGGELIAARGQIQQVFFDLRQLEALGEPPEEIGLLSKRFDALHGMQSIAVHAAAKAPRKGSPGGAERGSRSRTSMEGLVALDGAPLDRLGERVAVVRELIDLAALATEARRNFVKPIRNGSQLLDSVHASTNADEDFRMHPTTPQKSGRES